MVDTDSHDDNKKNSVNLNEPIQEFTDDELMRYSRQILLSNWDITAQQKLKESIVVIVGAGGLGCPSSETLARAGVGRIHIIDDDVIEPSNLQRQTLFNSRDIGQYKSEVAAKTLTDINGFIHISYDTKRLNEDNVAQLLKLDCRASFDAIKQSQYLLMDCTDNFATRELLNKASVTYGVPLLSASAIGMIGQLALYEPKENTGCYHCVFGNEIHDSSNDAPQQNCATSGVLASTTTVMGNLQANAALQYLGRGVNVLSGKLLIWDGGTMTQHLMRYRQDSQCPICTNKLA